MEQGHTPQLLYSPQEVQIPQNLVKPQRPWLKIILFLILGIFLFSGLVFAGYQLVGNKQVQPTSLQTPTPTAFNPLPVKPKQCDDKNVIGVYNCTNGTIKVLFKVLGAGFTLINKDGQQISCLVVPPQYIKEECKGLDCSEKNLCGSTEKVFCQTPRPEACTMECIANPPYICGSDRKSYCSTCQACSNPKVEWYVTQETPCSAQ